jgi:hypothetical protein
MRGGMWAFVPRLGRRSHFHYPSPWLRVRRLLDWAREHGSWIAAAQLALTVAVILHLGLVFLFPAGRNAFLGVDVTARIPYLTHWRPGDAFGFPTDSAPRGFIRYAVFAQSGQVQEGVFPNPQLKPNLRYLRWAAAGNVVSDDQPVLHDTVLHYLLNNLGSPPLKLDLYAGEWVLDSARPQARDDRTSGSLLLERAAERARVWKLGTHDGLTRSWKPFARNGTK